MLFLGSVNASHAVDATVRVFEHDPDDDECRASIKGVDDFGEGAYDIDVPPGTYAVTVSIEKSRVGPNGSCGFEVLAGGEILSGPGSDQGVIGFGGLVGDRNCCPPGESVSGKIRIFGPVLTITTPTDGKNDFLVATRENGSIVEGENNITISAKIENKPDDFNGEITWSFDGDVDNEDESTDPGESIEIGMTGERKESGRGNPMTATIRAETRLDNGEKLEDEVTIEQIEGDPVYNVVRQEYEDVVSNIGSHSEAQTLPSGFTTEGGKIPSATGKSQFTSEDYGWYLFRDSVIIGLNDARIWAQDNGLDVDPMYSVISNYRNPAHNRREDGAGNSNHMYGSAVDLRGAYRPYNALYPGMFSDDVKGKTKALEKVLMNHGGAKTETGFTDTYSDVDEGKVHAAWRR